jgi:hypothetical protein
MTKTVKTRLSELENKKRGVGKIKVSVCWEGINRDELEPGDSVIWMDETDKVRSEIIK